MPNPYLPTLPPFNYNDYGLTLFKPDMVLTHEQLNTLFGFLLGEEKRTRTRLIGIGIVCGLAVKLNPDKSITVSRGCGVTSEGDLICFDADKTYKSFLPYDLSEHAPYTPFNAISNFKPLELFPAEFTTTDTPTLLNTLPDISQMVVMLYLESQVKAADECTGVSCDNKGDLFNNRLHVLLVKRTEAAALIEATHQEAMMACSRLPTPPSRRVHFDALPYSISFNRFKVFVRNMGNTFSNTLSTCFNIVKKILTEDYPTSPIPQWQKVLSDKISLHSANANIQYVYDWLKDLFDAYNEFRDATCEWLVACAPPETAFPKHLLLGEFSTGCPPPQYRHRFIQSPTIGTDAKQKALWLFDRIGQLIEGFEMPDLRRRFEIALFTKITPSRTREVVLGDRAMPFYYKPDTKLFWSYDKMRRCRTDDILSFHLPNSPAAYVLNPFDFDIEKLLFYRIEGFLNENLLEVLTTIQNLRTQHNLAFDLIALRADAQQRLFITDGMYRFINLEREFDDVMDEVNCLTATLTPLKANVATDTPDKIKASPADMGGVSKAVFNKNPKIKAYIAKANRNIEKVINIGAQVLTASVVDESLATLRLSYTEFSKVMLGLKTALRPRQPKHTVDCIFEKLDTLDKIKKAYDARVKQIEDDLTFGNYLSKHPGMEHAAGVPRSGTFILVYTSSTLKSKTPTYTVIADFYLPYLCCGQGNNINIQLPEQPPTISLSQTRVCVGITPINIEVSPVGGIITDEQGLVISGNKYTPSVAGTQTLTYTLNGKTATATIEVLAIPVAAFRFDPSVNSVLFINTTPNMTEVTWNFGDSTSETIKISAAADGNIRHAYTFDILKGAKFTVTFTVSNGICSSVPVKQVITFKPQQPISIKIDPIICFSSQQTVTVNSDPIGGSFASSTLTIDSIKGTFIPNKIGKHTIKYSLTAQEVTAETFIVPNDFTIEKPRRDRPNKRSIVEVVLPTPPVGLTYQWFFEGGGAQSEVNAFQETPEGINTRYFIGLPLDIQGGQLTLLFKQGNTNICNKISKGFEIPRP